MGSWQPGSSVVGCSGLRVSDLVCQQPLPSMLQAPGQWAECPAPQLQSGQMGSLGAHRGSSRGPFGRIEKAKIEGINWGPWSWADYENSLCT